jgi:ribose transport system permease protein
VVSNAGAINPSAGQQGSGAGGASMLARLKRALPTDQAYLGVAFIVIVIVGSQLSPFFLTGQNITNILVTAAAISILAVAQFLVIVTAGIDLSVGASAGLSSVCAALLMQSHWSPGTSMVLALLAGGAVGAVNGLTIVYLGVTPFIATLATLGVTQGVAYLLQGGGELVTISDEKFVSLLNGEIGSVPVQVVYFIVIALVAAWVMRYTAFGRRLYAIGGNAESARLSGVPVKRDLISVYVISGLLSAFAGLLLAAELGQGAANLGQNYELDAIAAAVVGGTALFGGTGNPIGAVIGGLILGMILNIMNLRGVQSDPQLIVRGVVIIAAVAFIGGGRQSLAHLRTLLTVRRPGKVAQDG